jgi:hypothetical protein
VKTRGPAYYDSLDAKTPRDMLDLLDPEEAGLVVRLGDYQNFINYIGSNEVKNARNWKKSLRSSTTASHK